MKNNITRVLRNEYIFSIISKFCLIVIGLIESITLARFLGAEIRGELAYLYSLAGSIYLLFTFGIYTTYPFYRKNNAIEDILPSFFATTFILYSIYFILFIFSGILLLMYGYNIGYVLLLVPFLGLAEIISFIYIIESPNKANFTFILIALFQTICLLGICLWGSRNLMLGIFYYIFIAMIKIVYFTKKIGFHFSLSDFSIKTTLDLIKFGFMPMIALVLTTLNYRLDVIMLKQYSTVTLVDIGIYSIGVSLSDKALVVSDAIKNVLLSKLAKGSDENEVARVMRFCFLASIITAIGITIFSKLMIDIMYGAEFSGAEIITYISVWGTIFMVFFKMISQYNIVQHKQHLNVLFLIVSIVINITLNSLMIPLIGICGAAIATVVGYISSAGIFVIYFHKTTGVSYKKIFLINKSDLDILNRHFK